MTCADAGRRGPPIPWESGGGLFATSKAMNRGQMRVYFGSFRSGPMGPALTYAFAQNLLWSTCTQLFIVIMRVERGAAVGLNHAVGSVVLGLGLPFYAVAWCLLVGVVLSLLLSLAGARVPRRDCLRAVLYVSPAPYVVTTAMCLGPGRPQWTFFALLLAMWIARPLSYFARGRGELPDSTGHAAAFGAALVGVVLLGAPLAWALGGFR